MSSSANLPSIGPAGANTLGLSARDRSRRRKWIYGVLIIVLIVVLFVLSPRPR